MTKEQETANEYFKKYGWDHKTFFNRPHWTRRRFFEVLGAGVTGSFLAHRSLMAADSPAAGATKGGQMDIGILSAEAEAAEFALIDAPPQARINLVFCLDIGRAGTALHKAAGKI